MKLISDEILKSIIRGTVTDKDVAQALAVEIVDLRNDNELHKTRSQALRTALNEIDRMTAHRVEKMKIAMEALNKMVRATEEMGDGIYLCSQSCYKIAKEAIEQIKQVGK